MSSERTNRPHGSLPRSDWYEGNYLVAPHFAFTPCLTSLREAYGHDRYRNNWIMIGADIGRATRDLYRNHNLTLCRKYGLFIAGGEIDVRTQDRDRIMILVIELVKDEVHRWHDVDSDARQLLRDFGLNEVSNDDHGDHGVCVRYYVQWDGPRDADLFSRMSRLALANDYGIPSFAQPEDEGPPNVRLLQTVQQLRRDQQAAAREHGRPLTLPRPPAIPNERGFDDAYTDYSSRGDWLQRNRERRVVPPRIGAEHVEDISAGPRNNAQQSDADADAAWRNFVQAAAVANPYLRIPPADDPRALPRDSVHQAEPQSASDSALVARGLPSYVDGSHEAEVPSGADTRRNEEPQADHDDLVDSVPSDASDRAESEVLEEPALSAEDSHAEAEHPCMQQTTHMWMAFRVSEPRPHHFDSPDDLKPGFDDLAQLFGKSFKELHGSKDDKLTMQPLPAIEFR